MSRPGLGERLRVREGAGLLQRIRNHRITIDWSSVGFLIGPCRTEQWQKRQLARSKRSLLLESRRSKASKLISSLFRPPLGQRKLRWKLIRVNAEPTKRSSQNTLERVCPKPQLSVHGVLNRDVSRVHAAMIERTTRRL